MKTVPVPCPRYTLLPAEGKALAEHLLPMPIDRINDDFLALEGK